MGAEEVAVDYGLLHELLVTVAAGNVSHGPGQTCRLITRTGGALLCLLLISQWQHSPPLHPALLPPLPLPLLLPSALLDLPLRLGSFALRLLDFLDFLHYEVPVLVQVDVFLDQPVFPSKVSNQLAWLAWPGEALPVLAADQTLQIIGDVISEQLRGEMSPGQVGVEGIPPTLPCRSDVVLTDGTSLGQLLGLVGPRGRLPPPLTLQLARGLLRLLLGAVSLLQDQLTHLAALELLQLHQVVQVDILGPEDLIDLKVLYDVLHPQQTEQPEQFESVVLLGEITPGK